MPHLGHDLRFALRLLRKSPVASLVSALCLALGIGGSTAVFSLVDALLLRPLPAVGPLRGLVAVVGADAHDPAHDRPLSFADYQDYAGLRGAWRQLAAAADCDLTLTGRGPAEKLAGQAVSGSWFAALGLTAERGRLLTPADDQGAAPVAVLGHALSRRLFARDAAAVGAAVTLNGRSLTVVGVAPRGFTGADLATRREVWLPLGAYTQVASGILTPFSGKRDRAAEWLRVLGRLAPGASLAGAQAACDATARHLAAAYPATNARRRVRLLPLRDAALGPGEWRRPLVAGFAGRLMAVMALVLLTAALNVAGLLLARAVARRRETAVRVSLGASRRRLVQQLLAEGLVLAAGSALAGIAMAAAALPLLARIEPPGDVAVRELSLSGRALGFALLVACATCVLLALVPAMQTARTAAAAALRGAPPPRRLRGAGLREVLTGLQVAVAFVSLAAAGLFLRTLANLGAVPPGFNPAHVLVTSLDLAPERLKGPQVIAFYDGLLARLRRLPGVVEASMVAALPVMGSPIEVDLGVMPLGPGAAVRVGAEEPSVRHVLVGSRFFQTTGMRLLRGRCFEAQDGATAAGVVVLNQTAAERLWPGQDPLGRELQLGATSAFRVVGVVADSAYADRREKRVPALYLAHAQSGRSFISNLLAPQMTLLVRTAGDPLPMLTAVRAEVRALDPRLPAFATSTLDDLLAATVRNERQATTLYGALALLTASLALLGLFGVLTRFVVEQAPEIAVRAACGAAPGDLRRLVLVRSARVILAGLAAGLAVALPARRLVASQLFGLGAFDAATWVAAALLLLVLALLVSAVPAARAAAVDPARAMRRDGTQAL